MDKKLIRKFRAGKCKDEEVREILRWYRSEQMEATCAVEIENLWNSDDDPPLKNKDELFMLIQERILHKENNHVKEPFHQRGAIPQRSRSLFFSKLTVGLTFLSLIAVSGFIYFQPKLTNESLHGREVKFLSKTINRGQKYTMKLSDGTMVKLNSESEIHYPQNFSDSLRIIEFKGEAFFEVADDPTRPFVIRTGSINTTVLGTSFNIKTNNNADDFEVAVVTGSVKVSRESPDHSLDERYLTPNQQAVFSSKHNTFRVQNFDAEKVLAWVNGILVFENSSLEEITKKLENWYGVEIDATGLNQRILKGYTGNYKDKSLETVLNGISFVLGFEYEIRGKKVIIK